MHIYGGVSGDEKCRGSSSNVTSVSRGVYSRVHHSQRAADCSSSSDDSTPIFTRHQAAVIEDDVCVEATTSDLEDRVAKSITRDMPTELVKECSAKLSQSLLPKQSKVKAAVSKHFPSLRLSSDGYEALALLSSNVAFEAMSRFVVDKHNSNFLDSMLTLSKPLKPSAVDLLDYLRNGCDSDRLLSELHSSFRVLIERDNVSLAPDDDASSIRSYLDVPASDVTSSRSTVVGQACDDMITSDLAECYDSSVNVSLASVESASDGAKPVTQSLLTFFIKETK